MFATTAARNALLRSRVLPKLGRRSFGTPAWYHPHHHHNYVQSTQNASMAEYSITSYIAAAAGLCAAAVAFSPIQDLDALDLQSYCNEVLWFGACDYDTTIFPGH